MKKFALFFVFIAFLSAKDSEEYPLFGIVKDVASDDRLFIRAKATHRSQKLGGLPNGVQVAIESCQRVGRSTWCKIFQLPRHSDNKEFANGWVNARYLDLGNKGYVTIKGRENKCYYALFCNHNRCLVVTDFTYDKMIDRVLEIKKEKIHRKEITQSDKFAAIPKDGDGYCTTDTLINKAQ
jgi:hypothetical protein